MTRLFKVAIGLNCFVVAIAMALMARYPASHDPLGFGMIYTQIVTLTVATGLLSLAHAKNNRAVARLMGRGRTLTPVEHARHAGWLISRSRTPA